MPYVGVTDFEICGFHKQKSRYLKNETFFLQIKRFVNYTSNIKDYFIAKNSFEAEVTFK